MNKTVKTILALAMAAGLVMAGEYSYAQTQSEGEQQRSRHESMEDRNSGRRSERRRNSQAMKPEQIVRRMTRQLELDATQSAQVENIVLAAKPEFDALREKGMANRESRRNLDSADPDYDARMQELSAANGEIASSYAALRDRIRAEVDAILTEEQRAQLASAQEKNRQRGRTNQRRSESRPPLQ